MSNIKTAYEPTPLPIRDFDWVAWDDNLGLEPGTPMGYGRTKEIALANLEDELADYRETYGG